MNNKRKMKKKKEIKETNKQKRKPWGLQHKGTNSISISSEARRSSSWNQSVTEGKG
jgi:hypothetical protein